MVSDSLGVAANQISPSSEKSVTEQFEDCRSLQSPGSLLSSSPPDHWEEGMVESDRTEQPTRCVALFNFQAENPDELNMVDQEELELLGEGDDEGWVRARNYKGEVGYVPRSYLEIEGLVGGEVRPAEPQGFMGAPLLQQGFSFSSVDYSSTSIDFHPLEPIPEGVTVHFPQSPPDQPKVARQIKYCRALYDFDASNKAELSFKEHDIIKVLKTKTPSGVDDGWWEGEARGRLGLFPSLAVAPIRELGVASPPLHPRVGVSPSSLFPLGVFFFLLNEEEETP